MKVDPQTVATGYRTSKVVGSTVVNEANETVGTIDDLIVTPSEKVPFAVLSVGGFLGMGEKYHPLPWRILNYDDKQGAYVVNLTKEQLAAAPADSLDALTQSDGLGYRDRAYEYYKTERYW